VRGEAEHLALAKRSRMSAVVRVRQHRSEEFRSPPSIFTDPNLLQVMQICHQNKGRQ